MGVADARGTVLAGSRGSSMLGLGPTGTAVTSVGLKGVTTTMGDLVNTPGGEDDIVNPVLSMGGVRFELRVSWMSFLVTATLLDTSAILN